jgi:hypothetical protein
VRSFVWMGRYEWQQNEIGKGGKFRGMSNSAQKSGSFVEIAAF